MTLKQLIRYTNADAIEATWVRRDQMPDVEVPATPALYDKDGNEVQAAVEAHTKPGEIIETVLRCHAYSNDPEQIAMLRADLGADAAQYESLIAEVEATYVPPAPEPIPVPQQVTMRQARLELLSRRLLDDVGAMIEAAGREVQIEWEYASTVDRAALIVAGMQQQWGLTDAEIDDLFREAAKR